MLRETALASFVVLDDVFAMPGRKPAYIGGLREDQFALLEARLPKLRKDRLLVVALHIPLFEDAGADTFRDADRERLFAMLQDFPHVLVLSAHSHNQRHVFHDAADGWNGAAPLHEYNVGAACGAPAAWRYGTRRYWQGVNEQFSHGRSCGERKASGVRVARPKTASRDFFGRNMPLASTSTGSGKGFACRRVIRSKSLCCSAMSQPA